MININLKLSNGDLRTCYVLRVIFAWVLAIQCPLRRLMCLQPESAYNGILWDD